MPAFVSSRKVSGCVGSGVTAYNLSAYQQQTVMNICEISGGIKITIDLIASL